MSKLISCVAAAVMAASATALAATPIHLLLLGDSITRQGHYVGPLTGLLSQNGYAPTVLANEGHDAYLLVNMYDALFPDKYQPYTGTPSPFMSDRLHPNETAGAPMAKVWFDGIKAANVPRPSPK